jgi:signal transduction histidine kinase
VTSAAERIEAYGVVGSPEDAELHAIARLAAHICGVPSAMVNLLDDREQHTVAAERFELGTVAREQSMCATTLSEATPVHVPDATRDPRFRDNAFVDGRRGEIRFYAASLLRTSDGRAVGTLCVSSEEPHELDDSQRAALDDLAAQAVQVLELRAESRRLAAANDELHRSNADLAAFTGRIAHDLRNPIAATRGFLQLAMTRFGDELTGRARECVGHAEAATLRMSELVDDLLAFAAVGATARQVPVDVAEVAAAVVLDLASLVESSQGRVELGPLPQVSSDPTLLRQLLQNVISNGLKYQRPDLPPVVTVSGASYDGGWRISVADNGRGIPEQERAGVFELFARLPGGRDVAGSGIGLATCARIADALGSTITIGGAAGGGTTVTLQAGVGGPTAN